MELKDFCLTDRYPFISPQRLLDSSSSSSPADEAQSPASFLHSSPLSPAFPLGATPALSPSHPAFLLPSPAHSSSSSTSSSSSSYSLLCGAPEPDSPTGSSSSGGSVGGSAVVSEAAVRFSLSQTGSFSAQVDSILRGDFLTPMGAAGPKRLCLVCGDFASGYHYGVASCEACKAFFKRTIQGNIEYSCPVMNQCEITKRRRKACQACRFQKCLQAGMMREGVRMDRVRGGRQKYKRRVETGLSLYAKAPYSHAVSSRNKVISHLLLTEPAPLAANQDDSTNDSSLRTLLTLCDLLNRELLVLISWAKQIPGFSRLSLVDQMSLLQSGWMEALLVGVAWRSQGAAAEEIVFAGNLRLDEAQCRAAGLAELYKAVRHLTARYQAMNLSPEEAVTLKAMALANSDADPVDCPDSVQRFQDGLHEALQEYESTRREQHRAGRLLMSLPLLRQTADRAVEAFLWLHRHRCVPLHKLLLEMLDAKA
ncbi:estrogen-related receptor gamma isoform X1 [Micropterus dolomieu]|uniref:estrogen-related receptor gamma isoform X1 n=1 Tax=Micropterus dolomieu TaxID=147949 RepID=UPI001E8D7E6C|nr:estrogen-related receptor gamma isoform X1 [Micropterus dolomieu]